LADVGLGMNKPVANVSGVVTGVTAAVVTLRCMIVSLQRISQLRGFSSDQTSCALTMKRDRCQYVDKKLYKPYATSSHNSADNNMCN
jgi:hypothetical protein